MATTTAGAVAIELRRLADALDKAPETEVKQPSLYFYHWGEKELFLNVVRLLPRPLAKANDVSGSSCPSFIVRHETPALRLEASVQKDAMCELVEAAKPAVYKCHPLLSESEEDSVVPSAEGAL
jgi:hypothetical protein